MYTFEIDVTEEEFNKRLKKYKENVKKFSSTINLAFPRETNHIMKIVNENIPSSEYKIKKPYIPEEKILEG